LDSETRLTLKAVADTGFVFAVAVPKDPSHQACAAIFRAYSLIYLPQSVLAELGYLLVKVGGSRLASQFLRQLLVSKYQPVPLEGEDFLRTAELLDQYADTRVDFVDCTVVAIAERLKIARILTVDRRDFSAVTSASFVPSVSSILNFCYNLITHWRYAPIRSGFKIKNYSPLIAHYFLVPQPIAYLIRTRQRRIIQRINRCFHVGNVGVEG